MKVKQRIQNKKLTSGITLISLIVTIIILIILAGVSITLVLGDHGIIGRAKEAKFKTKMSAIAEEWDLHGGAIIIDSQGTTKLEETYAGELLKTIIVDEELDITDSVVQDIRKLLSNVGEKEETYTIIHEGELYYVSQKDIPNNDNQVKWCKEIGIKIWYYEKPSGIKVVNGDYEKVNGIWVCTPKINTGFVKEKTRYMKLDEKGDLVPGTWINKKPEDDWYDYDGEKDEAGNVISGPKWANLYVESSGLESYYVWIPRYVYKISETEHERTDVKFVDLRNNYKDPITDEETSWEQLQKDGYKIPEAFHWGDDEEYLKNKPIPGYWISKYQLSELLDTDDYTIDFSTVATPTSITIQNITVKEEVKDKIAAYQYALNGEILDTFPDGRDYKIAPLARGNKAVNVTILDANGEVLGSMTKLFETADINEPDLTGFDKNTTFYVYWDENGVEHNEIPITQPAPSEWYDYGIQRWANIVTRNNGLETYLVWIPRYQYALDTVSQRTYVRFIKGTGDATEGGYKVPEAFYWGDEEDYTKNKPITGYWISKYQLSTDEVVNITAEISAGGNRINVGDITGEKVTDDLKYEYYLNEVKVHEGTNAKENYVYKNLKEDTVYTVNIIAKNKTTNEYVGAITKKVETVAGNPPELKGFNENMTYYVLYDNDGNMTIGDNIQNSGRNMPENWYAYGERKWANIVVTDGTIENGKIVEGTATTTSYFVWIPRYQYSLDTVNQRTNVKLIKGTGEATEGGYKVPEAFYWGDNEDYTKNKPITGYWMSKYQLSE